MPLLFQGGAVIRFSINFASGNIVLKIDKSIKKTSKPDYSAYLFIFPSVIMFLLFVLYPMVLSLS